MELFGNVCAYLALVLLILFCIKPILRKTNKFNKLKIILIKQHVLMSILFVVLVVLHIIFSRNVDIRVMFGKLSLVFVFLSIIVCLFRKKLKNNFLKVHGILAIISLILVILHIIESMV